MLDQNPHAFCSTLTFRADYGTNLAIDSRHATAKLARQPHAFGPIGSGCLAPSTTHSMQRDGASVRPSLLLVPMPGVDGCGR